MKVKSVTVLVFAKDEVETIGKVLTAVQKSGVADEKVAVLDVGYHKDVAEILKRHGYKIIVHKLRSFAEHKNFGIKNCSSQWTLLLDGDEVIERELATELNGWKKTGAGDNSAYAIPRKNIFLGKVLKHCAAYPDYNIRLFATERARYYSPVHEILKVEGKVGKMKGHILHYTFRGWKLWLAKTDRYTALEARKRIKEGKNFSYIYLFFKPLKNFYSRYFKGKGFLDGWAGFVFCALSAYYYFKVAVKLRRDGR